MTTTPHDDSTALRKDVAALPWNHPARKAARKAAEARREQARQDALADSAARAEARKAAALEIPADPFAGLPGEMGA